MPGELAPLRVRFLAAGKALASLLAGGEPGEPGVDVLSGILSPSRNQVLRRTADQREHLKYYRESPPFRRVVHRIGLSVASARWRLWAFRGRRERVFASAYLSGPTKEARDVVLREAAAAGELVEVLEHPFLEMVRDGSPVPGLVGHLNDKVTEVCYTVAGEAFWVLQPNAAGAPSRAWLIPPHWVRDTPTIAAPTFRVEVPQGGSWDLPAAWVVWFKDPDPVDPYGRGIGYGHALADEIETDDDAAKQIRLFFHQGMKPEILLMGPGLKRDRREDIRRDWVDRLRGLYKRWQLHLIDAPKDAQLHKLTQDFEGDGLTKLRGYSAAVVRETLGVNPEILGEILGSNRATSYMARVNFREQVLAPRLEYRRVVYQHDVIPLYRSPRPLVVGWELAPVEDAEREVDYAKIAPWAASWGQQLRRQGLEPPDGADEIYLVPVGMIARRQEDLLNPPRPAAPAAPAPAGGPSTLPPAAAARDAALALLAAKKKALTPTAG